MQVVEREFGLRVTVGRVVVIKRYRGRLYSRNADIIRGMERG